jgi:CheY-like chemotaxis protein
MAITKDVAECLAVRAESKGLTIQIETKSRAPSIVQTDPVRLRQILMNLVGNAIKFTTFGQITLRLGVLDEADTSMALVEVVDNGIGLSPEEISHLFEPFYRVPGANTNGSGLGLAISRQLAEAMGGRISVESQPGRGTTFRLLIPQSDDMLPTAGNSDLIAVATRCKVPESLNANILLAEDNPAIQRVTALHLERLGAKVVLARNGEEAVETVILAQADDRPFDVVLMDMQMPVLDGYEATRQLRAHGYAGTIIALTAYAMPEDREESLRLGCDEHLSKPVDWGRLAWLIGEFLGQQARS